MCVRQVLHFLLFFIFLPVQLFNSRWHGVTAIQVSTSGSVQAVNGSDVRLRCTFVSSSKVKKNTVTISWSFRPLRPGVEESVFYFYEKPYPPVKGLFREKVVFVGDVLSHDASILVRDVTFSFNGTFTCQVKNPPDVHGNIGEVKFRVVASAPFSEIVILAVTIGGAVLLCIVILAIGMFLRRCRKLKRMEQESLGENEKTLRCGER
ncbi:myelin protein zero-like protein 2 isoform X1 [Silurus meridionalis]|uniref:myelin protein zero-like protein 2 isoform X1 n=1 Tax=Silurus meridionalis TaxID=175797 RepID=UPI001EEBACA9|nr:myelin protein zero-like protein 2 isoform X1 [Silurus meridionalis]